MTSYGIKINDNGTASYFAVIDKSLAAQKERIEKNAKKKAEEKKADAKKEQEEKTDKLKDKNLQIKAEKSDKVTVTASSVEELLKKINDIYYETLSDNVLTDDEKKLGQHFDMNI